MCLVIWNDLLVGKSAAAFGSLSHAPMHSFSQTRNSYRLEVNTAGLCAMLIQTPAWNNSAASGTQHKLIGESGSYWLSKNVGSLFFNYSIWFIFEISIDQGLETQSPPTSAEARNTEARIFEPEITMVPTDSNSTRRSLTAQVTI